MKKYLLLLITTIGFAQINPTAFNKIKVIGATKNNTATRIVVQDSLTKEYHWKLDNTDILNRNANSGILSGGALSVNGDPTKYDLATGKGYIVNSLTGVVTTVTWATQTALTTPYLATSVATYVLIDSTGNKVLQTTAPTPAQYRTHIYLGKLAHTTFTTILFAVTEPSRMFNVSGQVTDLNKFLGSGNIDGNIINYNGANLNINCTAGSMYRAGANYLNDRNSPSITTESAFTAGTFRNKYRNGTGGWIAVNSSVIDPNYYDNGSGTLVVVPNNKYTVKVFWRFGGTGTIHVDYGQTVYDSQAEALASIGKAITVEDPDNKRDASRRGWLVVKQNTINLSDPTHAVFVQADKFGERGISGVTSTLQTVYEGSITPQITTSTGLGSLDIKRGSATDDNNVFRVLNGAGNATTSITGNGAIISSDLSLTTSPTTSASGYDILTRNTSTGKVEKVSNNLAIQNTINFDPKTTKIAFLGDSITAGSGSTGGATSYADILNNLFGFQIYTKLGVSSATAKPTTPRPQLSDQVASIPVGTNFITVMIGINDWSENTVIGDVNAVLSKTYGSLDQNLSFSEAFRYNMETIKNNFPDAQIRVILPIKHGSGWVRDLDFKFYIEAEIQIANFLSIPVINVYDASGLMVDSPYVPDGIHPNDTGYAMLAEVVKKGIIDNKTTHYDNSFYNLLVGSSVKNGSTDVLQITGGGSTTGRFSIGSLYNAGRFTQITPSIIGSTPNIQAYLQGTGTDRLSLQGLGGSLFVGSLADNGSGDKLQINGGISSSSRFSIGGFSAGGRFMQFTPSLTTDAPNIQGYNSGVGTDYISLQGLGGRLFIGSLYDNGGGADVQITGSVGLNTAPTTSAGGYDILTRNTSTGKVEKVASTGFGDMTLGTNQSFTGIKSFTVASLSTPALNIVNSLTGGSSSFGVAVSNSNDGSGLLINQTSSGQGIKVNNSSTGDGILINQNGAGNGINIIASSSNGQKIRNLGGSFGNWILNESSGIGGYFQNHSSGNGIYVNNLATSTNTALVLNNQTGTTAKPFQYTKNSVEKAFINDAGDLSAQSVIANGIVRLKNYTVSTLPTGTQGDTAYVTDALAPTYMTTVVGGGAVVTPVFYNGTNWVAH